MLFDTALCALPEYVQLRNAVDRHTLPLTASGLSHFSKVHIIATLCEQSSRGALVITADENEANKVVADCNALGVSAVCMPARDLALRSVAAVSREYEQMQLSALTRAIHGDAQVLVCPADAAISFLPQKAAMRAATVTVRVGDELDMKTVLYALVQGGYTQADRVDGAGQFSHRGSIIDFFAPGAQYPVRLDFFGDTVDTIVTFDPVTQRREATQKSASIFPARELLIAPDVLKNRLEDYCRQRKSMSDTLRETVQADLSLLQGGVLPATADRYLFLTDSAGNTVFDLFADRLLFVSEYSKVRERLNGYYDSLCSDFEILAEDGCVAEGYDAYYLTYGEVNEKLQAGGAVVLDSLLYSSYDLTFREAISFRTRQITPWSSTAEALADDIKGSLAVGFGVVIAVTNQKTASILAEDLCRFDVKAQTVSKPVLPVAGQVLVTELPLTGGCEYPGSKFMIIPFGLPAARTKHRRQRAQAFGSLDELHAGDYIVHTVHGIGIFSGIVKRQMQGITKDYIKIQYAGNDVLYVPVTQLDLVSKYVGPSSEDAKIKIHRLSSADWEKTHARVRKAVKDIADQLIKLYAVRMQQKGFAFSPDCDAQRDFENRFVYEETDDQLRCCAEIKSDMERSIPMDRLLCGDVGFGKTEVALRAAFKAVLDGKQVAVLVPTTILAWQHFMTMQQRMEYSGMNIEMISRFVPASKQKTILERLKRGTVDILVGTHRLISSDVQFRDLGLVIVDEEQRFGVAHKEKLKELYPQVDILTLSATPIPRTLNMAMSGIRDMSLIEEAPGDRVPVQTYVMEENRGVLLEAIRRELRRGGQIYYLHNHVETIERCAALLANELPDARISVAHGRMKEEALSKEWSKLIEGETDILVCTTIIETGVDVPNVNTLIIEQADRMGLSQLHQLRGRVGRSSRRAYAYFTFRPGKELTDVARKRLEAMRDFTEFGSGFRIAMRDLEIRGAGNLLGAEQHGQMESVGYELYVRMLAEAVEAAKGEKPIPKLECTIDLQTDAHIPESYIPVLEQRLDAYRRIADIRTDADEADVLDELTDRYGPVPQGVDGLIEIAKIRCIAAQQGIYEVAQHGEWLHFYTNTLSQEQFDTLLTRYKRRFAVGAGEKSYFRIRSKPGEELIGCIRTVLFILQSLTANQ
ncbi:MAG: transcription-repair coupling factor [Clostridia bacterium]|nr:transcription-repair coupling factor [Clostridia bacterium]